MEVSFYFIFWIMYLRTAKGWKGTQEISQSKEDLSCNPEIYQVITIKLHKPLEE
jgi:hypothetical protein